MRDITETTMTTLGKFEASAVDMGESLLQHLPVSD